MEGNAMSDDERNQAARDLAHRIFTTATTDLACADTAVLEGLHFVAQGLADRVGRELKRRKAGGSTHG
jgi:hypothetical protein